MLNGVNCIGKHFLVRDKFISGLCIDVEEDTKVVLSTSNGTISCSIDDVIEIVNR